MNNPFIGSSFDDFLNEEGILDEVETKAVKEILVLQLVKAIEEQHLTKTQLAAKLETSRAAVNRLLDPENDSVTLQTLQRAAHVVGKRLKLELV
jgi:antitoxin HicB